MSIMLILIFSVFLFIQQNQRALSTLQKLSCTICSSDIELYYRSSVNAVLLGHQMREKIMRHPLGIKATTVPGRVIIVNSGFYRNTVAVIIKPGSVPPNSGSSTALFGGDLLRKEGSTSKHAFIVLAMLEKDSVNIQDPAPLPVTKVRMKRGGAGSLN
jgi:hypothetical protein